MFNVALKRNIHCSFDSYCAVYLPVGPFNGKLSDALGNTFVPLSVSTFLDFKPEPDVPVSSSSLCVILSKTNVKHKLLFTDLWKNHISLRTFNTNII